MWSQWGWLPFRVFVVYFLVTKKCAIEYAFYKKILSPSFPPPEFLYPQLFCVYKMTIVLRSQAIWPIPGTWKGNFIKNRFLTPWISSIHKLFGVYKMTIVPRNQAIWPILGTWKRHFINDKAGKT